MKRFILILTLFLTLLLAWPALAATTIETNSGNAIFGVLTNSLTNGLVLRLPMQNITWTGANGTNLDISGNGNHGGLLGGLANLTNAFAASPRGTGFKFPLSTDYIQCGSGSTLDDLDLANGMTISVWIKYPAASGAQYLVLKGTGAGYWQFIGSIGSYPYGFQFIKDCATTDYTETYACQVYSNAWNHIALTWNGNTTSNSTGLWINGRRVYSTSCTAGVGAKNSDAALNLTVGGVPGSDAFNGDMTQLDLFNRVLTEDEIRALCNDGRSMVGEPVASAPYTVTNYFDFDSLPVSTVMSAANWTNVTKGAAHAGFSLTGSANDWTIASIGSTLTPLSPVTCNGVTYSSVTNALACSLHSSSDSQFLMSFPSTTPTASFQFYFKTTMPQNVASGNTFDYFTIGSVANNGVGQIVEGAAQKHQAHTINDTVAYAGGGVISYPNVWYFCNGNWDTNAGLFHYRIYSTDDFPQPERKNTLLLYSKSPVRVGTNASYVIWIHGPHGQARSGYTNFYALASLSFVNATNKP